MSLASSLISPAVRSLARNKMRTCLTMLGIVIGVAAVIGTVAIGQGAGQSMQDSVSSLGSNMLMVQPGSINRGGLQIGNGQSKSITKMDEESIRKEVSGVAYMSGTVQTNAQVVWGTTNWYSQVIGVEPEYLQVRACGISEGTGFSSEDMDRAANVAILGETVRRKLFGISDPIGQTIRIKSLPFRIIGLLTAKGSSSFGQDQDDVVLIPLTTSQHKLTGITWLNTIMLSAVSPEESVNVQNNIVSLLHERHRIQEDATDDFAVQNMAEFANALKSLSTTLTLLLSAVASVALLVGGIGIMNIMLVSVTERTREIGIRMSIGATERDVQMQFLIEAVILSLLGGMIGIVVGESGSWLVSHLLSWQFSLSLTTLVLAVTFSATIGIGFGFYPARRASRLNPIEALRYE